MMLAPDPAWQSNSLADLAATIRAEHQAVLASHKMGAAHAMSAGDKLIVAKAKVKAAGGKWRDWVKENFEPHGLSYRTCRLYMQLARHRPEIEAEMAEVCHLSVNAALAAIAPAEPDDDAGDDDGGDDTGDDDGSTLSAEQRDQITALAQNYKWGAAQIAQALKLPLDDVRRFLEGDAGDAKAKPNLRVRPRGEDSDEWFTPPNVLAVARDVLGQFDLDPASCPEAQRNVQAVRYFSIADDGLKHEWRGRVWMNPPYSDPLLDRFVTKLINEHRAGNVTEAILLMHNNARSVWYKAL